MAENTQIKDPLTTAQTSGNTDADSNQPIGDTPKLSKKEKEELANQILKQETKHIPRSDQFSKVEKQVKDSIKKQETDKALKDLTVGALILGSSDIHFECFEDEVVVRFRIDGMLVEIFKIDKEEYRLIKERLKYNANLKLNITDIPQDGKYSYEIGDDRHVDVRVSTLPIKWGENIVCRILDASRSVVDFKQLGFFWTSKRLLEKAIQKRNGMIIVTGPTGSGKTTTLYTILAKLNTSDKKIITLEDPIEYDLPGIVQSEIDESKGMTFELGLKALMRQDPDIIMVGEIRNYETMNTATAAALTGHLVLSTLHTKSAADTLDRIANMGMAPYIIASAVDTIIAQRLVRRICPHCKREKEKTKAEVQILTSIMSEIGMANIPIENLKLYEGTGCEKCNNTGFKGRIGVYELITFNDEIRQLIREGASAHEIVEQARNNDFINMKEDGILKAIKGYTSIEEILRVI